MSRYTHLSRWPLAIIILLIATVFRAPEQTTAITPLRTDCPTLSEAEPNKNWAPLKTASRDIPNVAVAIKTAEPIGGHWFTVALFTLLTAIACKSAVPGRIVYFACCYILFCFSCIAYLAAIG